MGEGLSSCAIVGSKIEVSLLTLAAEEDVESGTAETETGTELVSFSVLPEEVLPVLCRPRLEPACEPCIDCAPSDVR